MCCLPSRGGEGLPRTILEGAAKTEFLRRGDTVRIWMDDEAGHPIFGVIEQTVS